MILKFQAVFVIVSGLQGFRVTGLQSYRVTGLQGYGKEKLVAGRRRDGRTFVRLEYQGQTIIKITVVKITADFVRESIFGLGAYKHWDKTETNIKYILLKQHAYKK